jgi:Flp pilus assembly protein TadG
MYIRDMIQFTKIKDRSSVISVSRRKLKDFSSNEDGGLIVLTLILLVTMLVVGGMAVDFMRQESARSKVQGITDIATLAATALGSTGDPDEIVRSHFLASGYDPSTVEIEIETDGASTRKVTVAAPVEINTIYLRLIGKPTLDAAAIATAVEGVNEVEISLVLDYSASMRTGGSTRSIRENSTTRRGRIGDLQDAARAFANVLLKPEYNGRFSLNIVPYGGTVNPGKDMFDHLNGQNSQRIYIEDSAFDLDYDSPFLLENTIFWADDANEGFPGEYVFAGPDGQFGQLVGFGISDDIPLSNLLLNGNDKLGDADNLRPETIGLSQYLFGPDGQYGTDDDDENVVDQNDQPILDSNGDPEKGDPAKIAFRYDTPAHCLDIPAADMATSTLPSAGLPQLDTFMRYGYKDWEIEQQVRGWGWCPGDDMRIQYAQQNASDVSTFFNQMTLYDGTGTDIGMKWGLALLDPTTRSTFTALNAVDSAIVPDASLGRPRDWDDPRSKKIIVLMTDGFITAQARLDQDPIVDDLQIKRDHEDGVSWHVEKTTTQAQFSALCDAAKHPSRDVQIYTVAFETSAAAGKLMSDCASSPANYYAADGASLTEVFENIAQQIAALRLSQ